MLTARAPHPASGDIRRVQRGHRPAPRTGKRRLAVQARDVGPPRHGTDHRCVCPPVGRRLADPQPERRAVPPEGARCVPSGGRGLAAAARARLEIVRSRCSYPVNPRVAGDPHRVAVTSGEYFGVLQWVNGAGTPPGTGRRLGAYRAPSAGRRHRRGPACPSPAARAVPRPRRAGEAGGRFRRR